MKRVNDSDGYVEVEQAQIKFNGFQHSSFELLKYIEAFGIFSILLKEGEVVHFTPTDKAAFINWLSYHRIENIKNK